MSRKRDKRAVIQVRKNLSTPAVIGIACHLIPEIHSSVVESPFFILPRNDRGGGKRWGNRAATPKSPNDINQTETTIQ
jgi:hypothetical protein